MATRANYGFEKAERERAKRAKKEAKARDKKAAAAGAPRDETAGGTAGTGSGEAAPGDVSGQGKP